MTLQQRPRKRILIPLIIIGSFIALFVLPFASWLIADEGMHHTGNADFCTDCHSMEPFTASYLEDVHGGNTSHGVQAECVDCHLTHDSSAAYFFNKAQTGIHDVYVERFGDPESVDWEGNREHRESFVYDSGCMQCHNNLENATQGSNKAFVAHHDYFAGTIEEQCVSCHKHVGHKDLGLYISDISK